MRVILIHGQGRTLLSMLPLGWQLKRHRHQVYNFGYLVFAETFEAITHRFIHFIEHKIGPEPYAIVAHSLGGIVTRAALPHLNDNLPQHLIMLAPPNRPAQIAKKAWSNPLYRLVTRDCGHKLSDSTFYQTLPLPAIPTTIIAGTKGLSGRYSPFGKETNDTLLSVRETELGEGYETVLVPVIHSLIMYSRQVTDIVLNRL